MQHLKIIVPFVLVVIAVIMFGWMSTSNPHIVQRGDKQMILNSWNWPLSAAYDNIVQTQTGYEAKDGRIVYMLNKMGKVTKKIDPDKLEKPSGSATTWMIWSACGHTAAYRMLYDVDHLGP